MTQLKFTLSSFVLFAALSNTNGHEPCEKSAITQAWYTAGTDLSFQATSAMKREFIVLVNKDSIATNFVSESEEFYRNNADTTGFYIDPTTGESVRLRGEELNRRKANRNAYLETANEMHRLSNSGKHQVWLINNSPDTIFLPLQDGSFICILEAQNEERNWKPVEYWQFSYCGNSYWTKGILPNTANSFVFDYPSTGDYSTVLRFKLLGGDQFYYSNEFRGKIDYCAMSEPDSTAYEFMYDLRKFLKIEGMYRE